jgi:hypothetical protein
MVEALSCEASTNADFVRPEMDRRGGMGGWIESFA